MKSLPISVLVVSGLSAICMVAPMFGSAGVIVALVASCFLVPLIFHYGFMNAMHQTHVHYHHYDEQPQPQQRPYTEGHERAALLPNGAQYRERIVRRYDQ